MIASDFLFRIKSASEVLRVSFVGRSSTSPLREQNTLQAIIIFVTQKR